MRHHRVGIVMEDITTFDVTWGALQQKTSQNEMSQRGDVITEDANKFSHCRGGSLQHKIWKN